MNRRSLLKAGIAGALGLALPQIVQEGIGKIQGVGVLRYPNRYYGELSARDIARDLADKITPGTIIAFSSETDADGRFVWDFRIEGGDPGQVRVERME